MCGIVGVLSQRNVVPILLEGLHRLEYRGYDSSGIAVVNANKIDRIREAGKVSCLVEKLEQHALFGETGIAHTRWATHGEPNKNNAHPHISNNRVALVHNGIIENNVSLRRDLKEDGYQFSSETDSEVIAHLIYSKLINSDNLLSAVQETMSLLKGTYAIVVIDKNEPDCLVAARFGSPIVIGLGIQENFVASDQLALFSVTRKFMYLEEGDIAKITAKTIKVYDSKGALVERLVKESSLEYDAGSKGYYRHFMLKEIHEQPNAITQTLEGRLEGNILNIDALGNHFKSILTSLEAIQIVACGTSYHSAMVARYWFEEIAQIPCRVEIASEFRYRSFIVPKKCLFITISQSGETADTLAALRLSKTRGYMASLCICNARGSSMVRESDLVFMTRAGIEIGVASTKAFTTQLVSLFMLVIGVGRYHGLTKREEGEYVKALRELPQQIEHILKLNTDIKKMAKDFADKDHTLFLGRGALYPIAMEGALKLKEISYIHAEAYAAGELKHGPLALIDENMPVVVVATNNDLLEKLTSNMEEVKSRGGQLYVFAAKKLGWKTSDCMKVLPIDEIPNSLTPILYSIPLQLLSYYVAVIKGTDIDQPRNLAKSVTVE